MIKTSVLTLDEQIDQAIAVANGRLGKSKVTIKRRGDSISLLGTLPVIEGGTKRKWIAMGKATLVNILEVERIAARINNHLAIGNLDWWELLPKKAEKEVIAVTTPEILTVGEWKKKFETHYFSSRKQTRKMLGTWSNSYSHYFKYMGDADTFTHENVEQWINKTKPDTKSREKLIMCIKKVAKFAKADSLIEWDKFPCKYEPVKRDLPTDEYIEQCYYQMRSDIAWTFGMLATYGLRPQEIFITEEALINKFLSPANTRNVFYVAEDTKTGCREVYPLHPEWVQKFELKTIVEPKWNIKKFATKVTKINGLFHRHGFNHPAYDLRHRYAVRASELGIAVEIASKWMGHTLEEHYKTYQKWMDSSTFDKEYDKLIAKE